jgi:hypothetical protein
MVAVFSGLVTREDLYDFLSLLREGEPPRFLGYFSPASDLTYLSVEELADLRAAIATRLREIKAEHALIALVCASDANAQVIDFWRRYVELDRDRPTSPALFSGVNSACAWLGLSEAAREALSEEVADAAPRRAALSKPEAEFPDPRI